MKKIFAFFLIIFLSVLGAAPFRIEEAGAAAIPVSAPSVVLMDRAGLIYSRTPHTPRAAASTVKILTAMVAMDRLPLGRVVTIPKYAEGVQPSKIHLRAGERYLVRDLIRATLINSANDAAETLAFAAGGGSRTAFAEAMNRKARAIGCRKSRFVRASGLPAKGHYTTAYDMALISQASQRYPFIVQTLKTRTCTIRSLRGRKIYLKNHNRYLWKYDAHPLVGKTGWTRAARHCFVGHVEVGSRKVFLSMLGSRRMWHDLQTLIRYAYGSAYRRVTRGMKVWGRHDIKQLQMALKRAGYDPGPADGIMGRATVAALKRFQKSQGLAADGIAGRRTWSRLEAIA